MQTLVRSTDTPAQRAEAVREAVEWLDRGEAVGVPTETVYGLASDALRPEAVLRIFEAKERPFFDPLIIHLAEKNWLQRLANVPQKSAALVELLTEKFWPGPLTLVLPRRDIVPEIVCAGLPSVALRLPSHPVFNEILSSFGRPLAAPSANRFGRISPTTAAHVMSELGGRIPLVVDAGATSHGIESTIVRVIDDKMQVLRPGPISGEELAAFGKVESVSAPAAAPGQFQSHYAPRTPLVLVREQNQFETQGRRCGILALQTISDSGRWQTAEILSGSGDLREAAARLFGALRRLDEAELDLIVAEQVPENGLGIAIMDRLRKAAAHG